MKKLTNTQFISKGISQLLLLGIISRNQNLSGYQIVKMIKNLSGDNISLKIGSIYPQLDQLEKASLIKKEIGSVSESTYMQKATYSITKEGIQELQNMITQWSEFNKLINKLLT